MPFWIDADALNGETRAPANALTLAVPGQSTPQLHGRLLRRLPALAQQRLGLLPRPVAAPWFAGVGPPPPRPRPVASSRPGHQAHPTPRQQPPAWLGLQTAAWRTACAQPPIPSRVVSVITPDIGLLGL